MSTTIDERIVEMQFDNSQFEKNVETSMSTLDRLKESLNLDGATKGFESIETAANNVDLSTIAAGVQALQERFSTLGIIGMEVIQSIADKLMSLASSLTSWFTSGIISGGWTRAMNLENAQFQLEGLLKDEEKVAAVMQNVNDAVDGTAYSLDAAAMVASQLAASGIEAGDAMFTSLRAVAGVAAQTNSEYSDIGQIFTTIAGNGRLMGEQLLQLSSRGFNAAATIADYLGTTESEVRSMVSAGKIDFETFAAAMDDAFGEHAKDANKTFTGAMSNIKAALARIGAKFFSPLIEQEGVLVTFFNTVRTKINEVNSNIDDLADMFVNFVSNTVSSFTTLIENLDVTVPMKIFYDGVYSVINICKALWSVLKPIGEAFLEVFPPASASQISNITEAIKNFTAKLKLSDEQSEKLKNTFKGLFSIVSVGVSFIKSFAKGIISLLGNFKDFDGGVLDATSSIADFFTGLKDSIDETDAFGFVVEKITSILQKAIDKIKELVSGIKEFASNAKNSVDSSGFSGLFDILEGLWELVKKLGSAIGDLFNNIGNSSFSDILGGGVLVALAYNLKSLIYAIRNVFGVGTSGKGGLLTSVVTTLNQLRSTLTSFQTNLKAESLIKLATAIAILAASMLVLSTLDSEKLSSSLAAMTVLFTELVTAMKVFNAGNTKITRLVDSRIFSQMATSMIKVSAAILILSIAMKSLASLDADELAVGMAGVAGLTAIVVASAKSMSKIDGKVMSGATSLVIFAAAIKVLASACTDLAALSWEELAKGLVGIGALLAELDIFLNTVKFGSSGQKMLSTAASVVIISAAIKILASACEDFGDMSWEGIAKGLVGVGALLAEIDIFLATAKTSGAKAITTAAGIVILAAAIKILASACSDFAGMNWSGIAKGLTSVGVLLAEITAFTKLNGNAKSMISTGLALIEIAAAMKIFASAVSDFGSMSWEDIAKGLIAMATALAEVAIAVKFMPSNMIVTGAGLIVVASALEIIANVVSKMGALSWDEVAKGLTAIGIALAEVAIALNVMTGTLSGSAALLVAAAAIEVLTPALQALGRMSIASIAKALITLAGAFTVIGVSAALLSGLTTTILALSGAFALIGVGVLAVGTGLLAAGAGLSAVAVGIAALAGSIVASAASIVSAISILINGIADAIVEASTSIGEIIKTIVLVTLDVFVECIPTIVDGALALITQVLVSLAEYTPQIVDALFLLIIGILEGVADNLPALIQSVVDVLMSFFSGVVDALKGIDFKTLLEGIACVGLMSALMVALAAVASLTPAAMVGVLGMSAVVLELAAVVAAIGALAQIPGLTWLIGEGGTLLQELGTAIGQFFGGIVGGFASGMSSQLPQIGEDLSAFMNAVRPFIEGASQIDASMLDGVKALVEVVLLLTAADILSGLASWFSFNGKSSLADFGAEIAEFGPYFSDYYESVKNVDGSVVEASANAAKALAEMANNLPNSGGVASWFAGDNTLSAFADELAIFGPKLKAYADSVDGLDADVVINSANAALALAEMAANLPNSGGVVSWFTGDNTLSAFADELSEFGPVLKDYADSVRGLDADVVEHSTEAAMAIAEFAHNLPNSGGVVSWFTGDNTLSAFADQLTEFGPSMMAYAQSVDGLDADVVSNSTTAAMALAELATNLPNSGGVVSWFTGDNTLSAFADELEEFGPSLMAYAQSVDGMSAETVTNSATAAKALFEMAEHLPDKNGFISWLTGNTLTALGTELESFGPSLKSYADSVDGLPSETVANSAAAAEALFKMAENLPEQGGFMSWFSGGAMSLSDFADELEEFGPGLMAYADSVDGLKSNAVDISATAAKSLFEIANNLPNQGAIVEWFSGGSITLSQMADELSKFGPSLMDYADSVDGLKGSVINNSVTAAEALFGLAGHLPEQGGFVDWFMGGAMSLSDFADELSKFGPSLMAYADSVDGLKSNAINNSTTAAKSLFEIANNLPSQSTVVEWFSGGTITLSQMATELSKFGPQLKAYADAVNGLKSSAVEHSTTAALSIFEMVTNLPAQGGISSWITGKTTLSDVADELAKFGPGLKSYSDVVTDVKSSVVISSANAAKALFEMAENLPNQNGITSWFNGKVSLSDFADELAAFGPNYKSYADSISETEPDVVTSSANAAKALAEFADALPNSGGLASLFSGNANIATFGQNLASFGVYFAEYYDSISGINTSTLSKVVAETKSLVDMAKGMAGMDTGVIKSFGQSLTNLGKSGVDGFISAFTGSADKVSSAVTSMLNAFVNGVNSNKGTLSNTFASLMQAIINTISGTQKDFKTAGRTITTQFVSGIRSYDSNAKTSVKEFISLLLTMVSNKYSDFETAGKTCVTRLVSGIQSKIDAPKEKFDSGVKSSVTAVRNYYSSFYDAGKYLVEGFASGISANTYQSTAKAKAMASAALKAANNTLQIASPSKASYKTGSFFGQGLVLALDDYGTKVYDASADMAGQASVGLSNALSTVSSLLDSEIELEPTIRPVLDLSEIQNGIGCIYNMMPDTSTIRASFSYDQAAMAGSMIGRSATQIFDDDDSESDSTDAEMLALMEQYLPYLKDIAEEQGDTPVDVDTVYRYVKKRISSEQYAKRRATGCST